MVKIYFDPEFQRKFISKMNLTFLTFNDKGEFKGSFARIAWVELNLRGFKSLERKIPRIMGGICLGD